MNSDNSALGGVTLDYGPFAFMEEYNPMYNPWVGDGRRGYAYSRQPQASATNLAVLSEAFAQLISVTARGEGMAAGEIKVLLDEVRGAVHARRVHIL